MFDRLRALSTRQQVLLVALVVSVTCVVMIAIWFAFLRVSYRPIFTNLRPTDAAGIIADLEQKKIPYELANGGSTILVPADLVDRTRLNVLTGEVPLTGTTGFELFDKSDMGLTDFAQKINYQRALQGELERTIAMLDGIDSARVHLSLGEDRIFRDDRVPPKASVMIRMQKGAILSADAAHGIQHMVAAAVPNLEVDNVVILNEKGDVIGDAPQTSIEHGLASPFAQEKQAIEQYYAARVRQALAGAYPLATMTIEVSAGIGTGANAQPGPAAATPEWNPLTRTFPLMVTVTPPDTLDASAMDNVRSLVASAIGSDPSKNDAITLAPAIDTSSAPERAVMPRHPALVMSYGEPADAIGSDEMALIIAIGFMILAAIGFLVWQGRRPRRMTDEQYADIAGRFRAVLDQGGSHGTS